MSLILLFFLLVSYKVKIDKHLVNNYLSSYLCSYVMSVSDICLYLKVCWARGCFSLIANGKEDAFHWWRKVVRSLRKGAQ